MALDKDALKSEIIAEVEKFGFTTQGEHSRFAQFAEAIATATVNHIQAAAEVEVTGGSSAGAYKVK